MNENKITELSKRLEALLQSHQSFHKEILQLQEEIELLNKEIGILKSKEPITPAPTLEPVVQKEIIKAPVIEKAAPPPSKPAGRSNLEKFIGENLAGTIGIVITIIGVAIGTKYAIDHDLIGPLTRIVLGYLLGLGLLVFAIRFRNKYENFSAVLLSGSMAIMYFITYAAYGFYNLIPGGLAFALMLVFTAFTVLASLHYNRQVISLIGMVGAYTIPFMVSNVVDNPLLHFGYMAIINMGILAISLQRFWAGLFYAAFIVTWSVVTNWYFSDYKPDQHLSLAIIFLFIFFAIFYVTFVYYKFRKKRILGFEDTLVILANSFIFYGLGYGIINRWASGENFLGLFTLSNAFIHFIAGLFIYRHKQTDKSLYYFVATLVLVFLTLAIPVELDGHWVTNLWSVEAALLFWIARTKNIPTYETLSYPLLGIAFISLIDDWTRYYSTYSVGNPETKLQLLWNANFFTSLLFIASIGFIIYLSQKIKTTSSSGWLDAFRKLSVYALPVTLLSAVYFTFRLEIATYWDQKIFSASGPPSYDFSDYKSIWLLNYSMLFFIILSMVNIVKIKRRWLGYINIGFNVLVIVVFLLQGLSILGDLRQAYLASPSDSASQSGIFNIVIRYIALVFLAGMLAITYLYTARIFSTKPIHVAYSVLFHITLVTILSNELVHWMDMAGYDQSNKLLMSVLWGIYSLLLIAMGIGRKKQHLRVMAIVLFAITLLKLFFYDIDHLNTIAKTVVFISLGILLLIISFLYNKFKGILFDEKDN